MKRILIVFSFVILLAIPSHAYKGRDENYAFIQSALGGQYYVRSIPEEKIGIKGTTKVYEVRNDSDELIDAYNFYMKGDVFLGWSPKAGKFALVHIEKDRVTEENWLQAIGKISQITFYLGGQKLKSYTKDDLIFLGVLKEESRLNLDIKIKGIEQILGTNDYVFSIEKSDQSAISFDITTGALFTNK